MGLSPERQLQTLYMKQGKEEIKNKKDEQLWYLKNFSVLKALSEDEKKHVREKTIMKSYGKGDQLFIAEFSRMNVYFLKKGFVRLSRTNEQGEETLDVLGPGEIFGKYFTAGHVNLENGEVGATALEDCLLCIMKRTDWVNMISKMPKLGFSVFKLAGLRILKLESRIERLQFKDTDERIRLALKDLTDSYGKDIGMGFEKELKLSITHNDIAKLAGASRQRTSSILKELENQNIISYNRKRILIRDYERLHS
jgi:CRP/FNR family transcriptional regulator, cyclic AMP receptor protein